MAAPTFFLDRGLGARVVPHALREAGWALQTMDERYGFDRSMSIPDTEWIRDIAAEGLVGISKDRNIARNGLEVDAVVASGCRLLLLPNAQLTSTDMAARILDQQRSIVREVDRKLGPWIAVIQRRGLEFVDLT